MAACAKCGSDATRVTYHHTGGGRFGAACIYGGHSKEHNEHPHYFCRTCQYDWTGPLTPPSPSTTWATLLATEGPASGA